MKIVWILVNCNSAKEAVAIGKNLLKLRLLACFDVFPRLATYYFWPPKKNKIEAGKGCLLIMETVRKNFKQIEKLVKKLHSDKLPFIGSLEIGNINPNYAKWLQSELRR